MKRKSYYKETTSILGGLQAERSRESEPYSSASGSTYGVEVLRTTLTKAVEIHGEVLQEKDILSLCLCQMSETLKPDVWGCSAHCNLHSLAPRLEKFGARKRDFSELKRGSWSVLRGKSVLPRYQQGHIVRIARGWQ